jgi:hypothetical protein
MMLEAIGHQITRKFSSIPLIKTWDDRYVVRLRLAKQLPNQKTIGELISQRGIKEVEILKLCGKWPVQSVLSYVNALSDTGGRSKDECDDNNSHAVS